MIDVNIMKQYISTGLKCKIIFDDRVRIKPEILTLTGIDEEDNELCKCRFKEAEGWWYIKDVFPILHPLSDLTKEIEIDGKKFIPLDMYYGTGCYSNYVRHPSGILSMRHSFVKKLYDWHFDVHGLIDSGDAIDINTLKDNDS